MAYYFVALPLPFAEPLTYQSTEPLVPGQIVHVPIGKRTLWGIVWQGTPKPREAKVIEEVHPHIALSEKTIAFLERARQYSMIPLGLLVKLVLPTISYDFAPTFLYGAVSKLPKKMDDRGIATIEEWACHSKSQTKTIQKWIDEGLLVQSACFFRPSFATKAPLLLTPSQQEVVAQWDPTKPYLIQGVTGSGKTEVGLALAEKVWRLQKQVLILAPEIGLCALWAKRLEKYFDLPVVLWHSGLSKAERQGAFERLAQGQALAVIGARSALFLPYKQLGLILIDEEHDASYKQEEGARYHARDMAVLRGHCDDVSTVLLSATPCIETLWNVERRAYKHGVLAKRYHDFPLPTLTLIDVRPYPGAACLSPPLRACLEETLGKGEQALLFLNKRGYAPLLLCYRCGYRGACPHCSVWLTVHNKKRLLCHHCGFEEPIPQKCPECSLETLLAQGLGVEKVVEEVTTLLPKARIAMLSSDIGPCQTAKLLKEIEERAVDVVIGTQLVAKGHHFPYLTMVGVVDADFALGDLDLRAQERLYQVLSQVVGRAGRENLPGKTLLQTAQPEHAFFQEFTKADVFLKNEMEKRRTFALPPFTRLASVILSGPKESEVEAAALALKQYAPSHPQVQVLGPTPAPLNPLRKQYRWRFLVKAMRTFPLQQFMAQWMACAKLPKALKTHIDIDPYSFL